MCLVLTRCCVHSKRSLGSHEYVQNCRKWENEITLQLLSQSTMRRDLARTVSPRVPPTVDLWEGQLSSVLLLRLKMMMLQLIWRSTWARWTVHLRKTSPGTAPLWEVMKGVVIVCNAHLCTCPPRQGLADYLEGYHSQVNLCLQNEVTQPPQTPSLLSPSAM